MSEESHQTSVVSKRKEWSRKAHETEWELILAEEKAQTQREKDIIHLKQIVLSIRPYSRWWRWGYIGSLRRAIKALENGGE